MNISSLRIGKRLGLAFGLLLCLLLGTGIVAYWGLNTLTTTARGMLHHDAQIAALAANINIGLGNQRRFEKDAFLNIKVADKRDSYFSKWSDTNDELESLDSKLREVILLDSDKAMLETIKSDHDTYSRGFNQVYARVKEGKIGTPQDGNAAMAEFKDAAHRMESTVTALCDAANQRLYKLEGLMQKAANKTISFVIVFILLAAVLMILVAVLITRSITRPVNEIKQITQQAAAGNLTQDISIHTDDEIGEMAASFKIMMTNLRRIAGEINSTTNTLASSSEELSTTSDDMSKGASELSSQTEQVVTAMTEVSQTIMDMAKNASSAADASKNASDTATNGKKIVENTARDMVRIAQTFQAAASTIEELGRSSTQIGEIVNVINGIADQTNLLALNAAIEAARAGEQGRGFAVVADEVRKLAERTSQATKDIAQRIQSIQKAAVESVNAMKKGSDEMDKGVGLAKEASASMDMIVSASTNAMDMVQLIAAATEEQSSASEEVSQNMGHISEITRQTSSSTEQIKGSAAALAKLAINLKEMTAWFKI